MAAAWQTVAEMQTRDLVRRRAAVLLLAGLPMTWYVAEAASGVSYAVGTGVLGMAWSAAAAALFAVLGARRVDQRLVQAGYRPRDLVVGRLVALLGISTLLAVLFGVVMTIGSRPARVGDVFLALLLTTVVSTPMGWLIAALVPRELEGTLLLIGLVGLQVSIPIGGPEWLVPYWAPLRLTDYDRSPIGPGWPILHALAWAVLIAVVAIALWRRRVQVRDSTTGRRGSVLTAR
jgi:ABC-type polysaccharide/polyol phosphate export permease